MLKQGDKINYIAQNYANAETVGTVDGTTVFVPQLIVGEQATVLVNYAKNNVAYADVCELLTPSEKRQNPPCPHFGKCGGCSLMHMRYDEQLLFKQNKVANNLRKIGGINAEVLPCVPSEEILGYRNKLSLPVRGKAKNVSIGMYRKGSHSVVNVDDCLLGGEWCKTLVGLFRDFLNEQGIAPYNEKNFSGQVRHLVARCVNNQLLVTVVCNGSCKIDLLPFAKRLQRNFPKVGLFVNENNLKNNVILGEKTTHVFGLKRIEGEHLGVKFRLHPNSFFQVNNGVKDAIYKKVQQLLDLSETQVLVDCFSGVGILTNVLASEKFQTFAVEIDPNAVRDANEIAKLNNAPNVTNLCADVNEALPRLTKEHASKVMTLVVDPPRKGLGEVICNTIVQARVNNVVYVSCDSATLSRDLHMLSEHYNVSYVEPYDMFPQAAEVETLVHLVLRQ